MAITRKPKAAGAPGPVNVDELINRGGRPGNQTTENARATTAVVLRIPTVMLQYIDAAVKAQPIKTQRHRWILEALHEKLSREEKK
jgi:hypothetical protein